VSENLESDIAPVERLNAPDPFDLARRVHQRVHCCCSGTPGQADRITYLWVYAAKPIKDSQAGSPPHVLSVEDWYNVVDEAAAGGIRGIVITVPESLAQFPHLWAICRWAQEMHGLFVGLHTYADCLSDAELAELKLLDLHRTRLFVSREACPKLKALEDEGLTICVAQPPEDFTPPITCALPGRMVFVNPEGVLYTCGMVEGNEHFRLGTIFEGTFTSILENPALPHAVQTADATNVHGCDGCPPLFAHYFGQEQQSCH
jgi:radical SAM protein with 4Fe4S-binding SPASM domain